MTYSRVYKCTYLNSGGGAISVTLGGEGELVHFSEIFIWRPRSDWTSQCTIELAQACQWKVMMNNLMRHGMGEAEIHKGDIISTVVYNIRLCIPAEHGG